MTKRLSHRLSLLLALSLGGPLLADNGPASLYLRAGTVQTARTELTLASAINARVPGPVVVQLDGPITPQRRARLAAAGVSIGSYLPDNAYICTLDGGDAAAAAGLEFVRWVGRYRDAWKLDPELGNRQYQTQERLALVATGRDLYTVSVFAGADVGQTEKAVWAVKGAAIRDEEQIGDHMEFLVEMPAAAVAGVARIAGVQYIEPAPDITDRSNLTTRWIVQSNVLNVTPVYAAGIHGEGQIVGILDGRVDINHCSFRDTSGAAVGPLHRKVVGMLSTGSSNSHGTHVAGIAVGDGGLEDNTRGVAYLAKLSWASYDLSGTTFTSSTTFNRNNGARIHTNSWGNDGTTSYDGLCRAVDAFAYSFEDDVVCFAVTNQSLLKNPENAKNVVAVGNTQDTPSTSSICTGGAGPTSDGRRKPEIWAPGCATLSSQSGSSCGTVALTGTSMASPAIAGTALLVRQYYTAGYYPAGTASGNGFTPSGALIRATLMNTGQDLTGAASGFQVPTGYPSTQEGWGRVRIDDALYFPGDARKLVVRDVRNASGLSTGGQDELTINVSDSAQQLRVTLAWTEPAATAGAANPVINDLDLEVVSPGGSTYLGNVFNTGSGASITGGTKDAKNIIEQVHIPSPTVGQWTIRVRGAAVAQGTQGFAVVATGSVSTSAGACYANCDGSSTAPVLNVNDFICFQQLYAAGDSYANCDNSTVAPVLNVNDFICFQQQFAAGCP